MSGIRDRDDAMALMRRLESRVAKLERQTPAARTSITRGQFRVASVEGLVVEGSAKVSGLLNGTGTLTWTGPANLNGNTIVGGTLQVTSSLTTGGTTTVNGTLTVNATTNLGGNTTISGTLSITGNVTISGTLNVSGQMTVTNNVNVTGGGTISAGAVTISPANGGRLQAGSTIISSDGRLSNSGGPLFIDAGLQVSSTLNNPGMASRSTAPSGNYPVYADQFGTLFKYTG